MQLDDIFISDSETEKSIIRASAGENGTIAPAGIIVVPQLQNISFTFIPNKDYVVDSLWVDNIYISNSIHSYTFENVSSNHTIHVTFAPELSIGESNFESNIVLYPNPTTCEFHVTFPSFEGGVVSHSLHVTNIEVFDVYGRK